MSKPILNALFIFDATYLSPALISVSSFLKIVDEKNVPVTMVFLVGEDEGVNQIVRAVLRRYEDVVKDRQGPSGGMSLQLIELRGNVFDDYVKRYHFSSTILYKAIIPQAFLHYEHILLFDCGMIFGHRLHDFLEWVGQSISSCTIAPIAAFCVPSAMGDLSGELKGYAHNPLYPTGGTLYFDVKRYEKYLIYDRLVSNFKRYRERLIYAEQDLLCLTLEGAELSTFPECGPRCHIDLASGDWGVGKQHERLYESRDFFYIKHVGSFKPWKKWVLHPSKAIFLRERRKLGQLLGMEYLEHLRDDELFPEKIGFLAQQLMLLEGYYEHKQ
jgi:hypothetical protein